MMDCRNFRRAVGADPQHPTADALTHRDACPECARYLRETLQLDATLLDALRVPAPTARPAQTVPLDAGRKRRSAAARSALTDRRRWYALAASVVVGVLVGTLLWTSGSRDALARDAVAHMNHEPGSMEATDVPVDPERVRQILERAGLRLRSGPGLVSYAQSCPFHGHTVPHLVVQTPDGPVTVLVLPAEPIRRARPFHEQGYDGLLEPAGPGSIAVIGASPTQVREAAARVMAAVEWLRK